MQRLAQAELSAAMSEMDGDGDGSVDFGEFWKWWQGQAARERITGTTGGSSWLGGGGLGGLFKRGRKKSGPEAE